MLSWSSTETGGSADISAVGSGGGDSGVDHGLELLRFAAECAGQDDDELADARARLIEAADEAFMIDAAAVAANFEMLTRAADSTGSRLPADQLASQTDEISAMNAESLTSRR